MMNESETSRGNVENDQDAVNPMLYLRVPSAKEYLEAKKAAHKRAQDRSCAAMEERERKRREIEDRRLFEENMERRLECKLKAHQHEIEADRYDYETKKTLVSGAKDILIILLGSAGAWYLISSVFQSLINYMTHM